MSEVPIRAVAHRGRGGYRGGRGPHRGRGGYTSRSHTQGEDGTELPTTTLTDQGEVGELKKKYGDKVPLLREVCPGWSDEDLVYALQETDGNVDDAVDRISTGMSCDHRNID